MELPFAGTHQLCAPMLGKLDALPRPQRDALRVALGLATGDVPDRFLVGLAVLGLLSAVAEERPLLCLVEDAQWLDAASSQVLGFVARRVLAESVAIVVAVREPASMRDFDDLPELRLEGLRGGGCARHAGRRRPRPARRRRARPDRRRDAWQSARAPGAAEAHDRCGAGRWLRAARRQGPSGAYRGPLSAARRRAARGDAATDAAGGRRPVGGCDACLARRAEARHRDQRARARRGCGAAGDRRAGPVPPSAGALGGLSRGVSRRPPAGARSSGGDERSGDRRRSARVAPCAGGSGTR